MKRTAYAALACLTLALATYLVYRGGMLPPVHHGPVLGPHYVPAVGHRPVPSGIVRLHTYRVRAGDCLWSIGRRRGVDWRVLARANHVHTPYLIFPGQVLSWR